MKKIFYLFLLVIFSCVSCDEIGKYLDTESKGLVFAEGTEMTAVFGSSGGSKIYNFTSDLDWKVTTSAGWIAVNPQSGTPNASKFTIKVGANETFEDRNGFVIITTVDGKNQRINVKQDCEDKVFEINSDGEYEVAATGGEVKVKVTTNLEYTVDIPKEATWLTLVGTRAVREETLTFAVAQNTLFEERSTIVKLKNSEGKVLQAIVFRQKADEQIFTTNSNGEYEVIAAGGEVKVKVTTNLEYIVDIPKEATWLTLAGTRAVREETLTFAVAQNSSFEVRSAIVSLKNTDGTILQEIVFRQRADEPVFAIDGSGEYEIEDTGGEVKVKLTTNLEYSVNIPQEATWLNLAGTRATHQEDLVFVIAKNETLDSRQAIVKLLASNNKEIELKFTQKSLDVVFTLDKYSHLFDKSGGVVDVILTTNIDYTIAVADVASSSWLSYSSDAQRITISVQPMADNNYRSADILFKDSKGGERAIFRVEQDASYRINYTTNNAQVVEVNKTEEFGAPYLGNLYNPESGTGALRFSAPITAIPEQAFALCSNLTTIELPEGVVSIGDSAFSGCSSMSEIIIPSTVTKVGVEAFVNCTGRAVINCEIVGNDSYDSYDDVSFTKSAFSEVVIGDGVTNVGYYAFYDCDKLKRVVFGKDVKTVGSHAFASCDSITNILLPEGLTTIGGSAFWTCDNLANLIIPSSVTSIGSSAFSLCSNLTTVYCKPVVPPTIENGNIFTASSYLNIYIPENSVKDYKLAAYWSEFANNYIMYDYATETIVDPNHKAHPRDKWIGTWTTKSMQTMTIDPEITFTEQTMEFDITIIPHSLYEDEVLIYGLSATNRVARGLVAVDGTLNLVSGISVGDKNADGYEPTWLIYYDLNGQTGFLLEQCVSYIFAQNADGNSAVATPSVLHTDNGLTVKILSTEVYAVNHTTQKMGFYTDAFPVTYHAGKFELQRAGVQVKAASMQPIIVTPKVNSYHRKAALLEDRF